MLSGAQRDLHTPPAWEVKGASNLEQCLVKSAPWVCKDCGFLKLILISLQRMPYILSLFLLWSLLSPHEATEQQVQKCERQGRMKGSGAGPGSLAL